MRNAANASPLLFIFLALAAAMLVVGAAPAFAEGVAPLCPSGYSYKAGTALCESSKPPSCTTNDPRIPDTCVRYDTGANKCVKTYAQALPKGHICSTLVSNGTLKCPAGHTLRPAQDDCYASQSARCPTGYTLKASIGRCLVGKAQ